MILTELVVEDPGVKGYVVIVRDRFITSGFILFWFSVLAMALTVNNMRVHIARDDQWLFVLSYCLFWLSCSAVVSNNSCRKQYLVRKYLADLAKGRW